MGDTFDDLERSDRPFWSASLPEATASGALTPDTFRRALEAIEGRTAPQPTYFLTSAAIIEAAGNGIGYPELDAHFERLARGAAHTIFGNIALNVRDAVTPMQAGRYAIGGEWPFRVAEWSLPQRVWE